MLRAMLLIKAEIGLGTEWAKSTATQKAGA
jgi:hypothetical protein